MEFPVWFTPGLSKGLIIAVVSVLHVFVAQFAVGGGLYLVLMERKAHALGERAHPELFGWLHRHTFFFLLLTMVFGALTGVGVWLTMSVSNPAATSTLIHIFLWVWAAEWVFFLLEVVSLLVYYYTYPLMLSGRLSPKTHLRIGYLYAAGAYLSLVLINGVICFMLTPGQALETRSLFDAFLNPSFFPSLFFRSALCLMLAGMFAMFTASRIQDTDTRRMVIRISSLLVCIPFVVLLVSSLWYYLALPADRQAAMLRRTADIHPFVIAYGWILPVIFLLGVLAFARAEKLRRPLTVLILCTGLVLVGSFEWMRETGRRPWVIPGYMYSSSVRLEAGPQLKERGIAAASGWLRELPAFARQNKEKIMSAAGTQDSRESLPAEALRMLEGEMIFAQQCGTCHAVGGARLDILPRLVRFTPNGLAAQIRGQGSPPLDYMPPFYGNEKDIEALVSYLNAVMNRN